MGQSERSYCATATIGSTTSGGAAAGIDSGTSSSMNALTTVPAGTRGSNENTNRLLRQYFPKGTDLSVHTRERLNEVARELNQRPRKTPGYETRAEHLKRVLRPPPESAV